MHDIKLEKARLKFEAKLHEEKLKNANYHIFSGFSSSVQSIKHNIRNRLISYSIFRSLYKSNFVYDFVKNFYKGIRQSR